MDEGPVWKRPPTLAAIGTLAVAFLVGGIILTLKSGFADNNVDPAKSKIAANPADINPSTSKPTSTTKSKPAQPKPRRGVDHKLDRGGQGRALIVVSSEAFVGDQFKALTHTLKKRNVNVVVASTKYGTGEKEHGLELRKLFKQDTSR